MKKTLSSIAVAVLATSLAHAQVPEQLASAARKAVASNPDVLARWHGFEAAARERDAARGAYLPQLDLSASVGSEERTSAAQPAATRFGPRTSQISLNQIVFNGGFTGAEIKRLGYAQRTRYYELLDASETTALETVRAYADVARYRELVEVATRNYAEHRATFLQVQERANAGVGRRVDVEQATGRLALAESNLLTELTNLHDVSARYVRLVGEKPPAELPAFPAKFSLSEMSRDLPKVLREGLMANPAFNAAVQNARASQTAIDSRKAAYAPRVDLRAFASRDSNVQGLAGRTSANGVELVLSYNLFNGGADQARERQAISLHEQARAQQEKACRDARQTLTLAYNDANSLLDQLQYNDQFRLSTEKANEAYRQQFELGQRTLLDLLDSQNEFFEATRSYINARYNQIVAQARTLSAMGQLLPALKIERGAMTQDAALEQDPVALAAADLCAQESPALESIEKIKATLVIPTRARTPASEIPATPAR